jgi:hypothetical protein
MPETTTVEKVQEGAREYMREAEKVAQDAFKTGNDFMTSTMNFYFDGFDKMTKAGMEMTDKTWHAMDDMMVIYRKVYTESFKGFQDYLAEVNKIFVRPTK